jgi:NADPH:quinone reductase-like Zn-dependent oxidoreductase
MAMIRALQLLADRQVALTERETPPAPGPNEVQLRVRAVGLNHIDVWGFRGMAFAKRLYPLTVGAEAACEVVAVGDGVANVGVGDRVVPFSALTCGVCPACLRGRDNLCENVAGVRGFHVDGFAQDLTNHPARLLVKIPDAVSMQDAACVAVAYGTVEHMLFDNAHLEPGETVLVHAGGSGIGSIAIRIARSIGCTVITTVGSADKAEKARALERIATGVRPVVDTVYGLSDFRAGVDRLEARDVFGKLVIEL